MSEFETLKTIPVPAEIYEWKASPATRERAQEVQDCNRKRFPAGVLRWAGSFGL